MFDYIEMFYNPKHNHVRNWMLLPVEFDRQPIVNEEGVQTSRCYAFPFLFHHDIAKGAP